MPPDLLSEFEAMLYVGFRISRVNKGASFHPVFPHTFSLVDSLLPHPSQPLAAPGPAPIFPTILLFILFAPHATSGLIAPLFGHYEFNKHSRGGTTVRSEAVARRREAAFSVMHGKETGQMSAET